MLNKHKFNNKKGFSLALALVISLFLLMVTGGITTVAILQNNETGSDMNTRQAYISAKSGLDSMQDMIKLGTVTQADLPTTAGKESFIVALQLDDDSIVRKSFSNEQDAQKFVKLVKQKLENPTANVGDSYIDSMGSKIKAIVGGEGTYFRIKNLGNGKYSVTAENITGKYNNNVTQNKGELSFDAVITTKYVFEGEAASENPSSPTGVSNGKFLMVGQQSALNENSFGQGTDNSKSILLQRYQVWDTNAVTGDKFYYAPSVEAGADGANIRTYFPVVYDRAIKVESNDQRAGMYAYNQGIYLYGGIAESVAPNATNHVNETLKNDYGRYYDDGSEVGSYGLVSYLTQNTEYHPGFRCAFLVIKNNCITTKNSPRVQYFGSDSKGYVYIHLINNVTFFTSNGDGRIYKDANKTFTKTAGYYRIKSGEELFNAGNWETVTESNYKVETKDADLSADLDRYYENGGTIHSGCKETGVESAIEITDDKGRFLKNGDNHSYTKDNFTYKNDREKVNLFVSPNFSPTDIGYYRMYAGRSMNFQWFREADFNVKNQVHIELSAPTVVLTIGPSVDHEAVKTEKKIIDGKEVEVPVTQKVIEGGKEVEKLVTEIRPVEVSKVISKEKDGNGSFELYGDRGSGSCKLVVMCDFTVKYDGNEYTVHEGVYSTIPEGLDLFSDEARDYFTDNAPKKSSVPGGGTPGSIGSVNNSGSNMSGITRGFSSFFSSFIPTPSAVSSITGSGAKNISQSDISGNTAITVGADVTALLYKNVSGTGINKCNKLYVSSGDLTIKKTFGDGTVVDYITFKKGSYKIPCSSSDEADGVNIYSGAILKNRAALTGSNYRCVGETTSVVILKEYY